MKPVAGRPVTICCGCFSMKTRRTKLGTYYCDACLASAMAYAETIRARDRALRMGLSPLLKKVAA